MDNLIIISSSTKTEHLRKFLQTMIEVKIDVVTDIDQALQDIFVKRPAVVCIQSRIAGINAVDICRHIQMLLRKDAPSFILMHEGDNNAKPVKGLFEHLLDLTLPETELAEALAAALKSILGTQWERVLLSPPPQQDEAFETADDTLSPPQGEPDAGGDGVFELANSLNELMIAMPDSQAAEQEKSPHPDKAPKDAAPVAAIHNSAPSRPLPEERREPAKLMVDETLSPEDTTAPPKTIVSSSPSSTHPAPPPRPAPASSAATSAQRDSSPAPTPPVSAPSVALFPGDFRITTTTAPADKREQNDMAPFIENFELPNRRWKRRAGIALVIVVGAAAGAWHLLRQKPVAVTALPLPPASVATAQRQSAPVQTVVLKAVSRARPIPGNAAAPLPAFVPADGRDDRYAARHPGWERYAGAGYECRIFRENDHIRAVQVLSGKRQSLNEELLNKVLAELVGSTRYRVTSRERVKGYLIERARVADKADLMLYAKESKLHAIVVSLN